MKTDRSKYPYQRSVITIWLGFLLLLTPLLTLYPHRITRSLTPRSFGNAVWMHVDTFQGTSMKTLENLGRFLQLNGIQKVIVLGKNIDGSVPYPSKIALEERTSQAMSMLVTELKKQQMKVYFYFPVNTDPLWINHHPEDIAIQMGPSSPDDLRPDPEKKLVNLTSQNYIQYISQLCVEAVQQFALDGFQLDYIRYRNGQYGFSNVEMQRALAKGVNLSKIQTLTYQTFVKPGDWKTLLQKYDQHDPDVVAWAKIREDIITDFVTSVKGTVHDKTKADIGLTLVSSGATAEAYTAIHFGQNWERLSSFIDFATPMAYHGSESDPSGYVARICDGAIRKIHPNCEISIGLQAHATTTEKLQVVIETVKEKRLPYCLFRIGTFAFSHMGISPTAPEKLQLQAYWMNVGENVTLEAFSLENTGSALLENDLSQPLKWKLPQSATIGQTGSMAVSLQTNWNRASQCCVPLLVMHTKTAVMPTLQHTSWKTQHILYSIPRQTCQLNRKQVDSRFLKVLEGQTWLNLSLLPTPLSIGIQQNGVTFSAWDQQNGMRIEYLNDHITVQKRIQSTWMETEILSQPAETGWFPAKMFFQFFRYQIAYNDKERVVHFVRWTPVLSTSLALSGKTSLEDGHLFLIDGSVWVEWGEYFQTSFYSLTSKAHELGHQVILYLPIDEKKSVQPETDWFMMQTGMKRKYAPDDYVFWLASLECLPPNPKKRLLLLPSNVNTIDSQEAGHFAYRWGIDQPIPDNATIPVLWMQNAEKSKLELETLLQLYDQKRVVSIVNWQNTYPPEK